MYEYNELKCFIKTIHTKLNGVKLSGFSIINGEIVANEIEDDDFFSISDNFETDTNIKELEAEAEGLEYYNQYRQLIDDAEKVLTDRELWILFERLDGKSMREVGNMVMLSYERVRQLENQLVKKICEAYKSD